MSSSTKILVGKVSVEKVASKVKEILLDNENTDKIVDDDVWTVVKEFEAENGLNSAQIKHYNAFVYEHIQEVVSTFREIKITENDKTYIIEFQEVFLKPPFESDETGNKLYPTSALQRNITYAAALHCDITITPPSGEPSYYAKVFIGSIPVMVLSDLCNMTAICHDAQKLASKNENIYDIGGYFVVAPKGENSTGATAQRRVLGAQEKAAPNLIQVFATKRKHNPKFASYAEVKSSGNGIHTTTTIVGIIGNPQRIGVVLPWIDATEIPIGIVFKALGVETDREAVVFILGPNYQSDREALKFIVPSLEYSYEIGTQEEALFYIGIKARIFKDDDDAEDGEDEDEKSALQKAERKKKKVVNDKKVRSDAIEYAKRLLSQEFLPHVGSGMDTYPQKAKYLGYIVQKLIWVVLNRQKPGLRDHYMAKRVMTSGELLTQQFYSAFRRLVMEITNNTRKALKNGNNVNILSWIKPTIITNAMNGAISGNNWASGGPTSKGISQTYEEFNHASCAANMRKQTVPMAAEGGKVIEPRDLHGSHFGIVCVTGDTMVLLADGFTWSRIDKLEGKPIMTVNPLTLENEPSGIHNYIKILPKKLLFVKDDCGREIKCTPDHPFLVHKNGKNEWKKAGELRKGDKLVVLDLSSDIEIRRKLSEDKAFSYINSIENIDTEHVYDFTTISDNHSFIANGFVTHNCPAETPEGKKAGLVKNMALTALITIGSSPAPVRKIIETILGTKAEENFPASLSWTRVFLNGSPLGETNTPTDLVKRLVRYRRNAKLNPETSIAYFDFLNEIHISVDAGRMCRPLFVVEDGEMPFRVAEAEKLAAGEMTWTQLLASGMVEIVDKAEEENCVIAGFPSELENLAKTKNPLLQKITHCEIHPSLMFGIGGSIIPFPDHNQSPRNCYQASMGKQAVGTPFTNFRQVMSGTFHTMEYTQKPLCLSRAGSIVKFDEMPAGQNAIIAVMPRPYNEEDSIEMSDASVQRGFMVSYKWTCYYSEIREERRESFGIPQPETCDRIKGNTKNLTEEGFPKSGTIIKAGDVIIGKLVENEIGDALVASKKKRFGDSSIVYDHAWPARVDKIQIGTTGDGYKYIRVMLCQRRAPVVGDKFCYTPDHEVLTTKGWVSVTDIKYDHEIASLNQETGELEYQLPTEIVSFDYESEEDGNMVLVDTNQVNLCVTPNHKMYVKRRGRKEFKLEKARDLFDVHVHYKKSAEWVVSGLNCFTLPEYWHQNTKYTATLYPKRNLSIKPWLVFLGIWLAEGWACKGRIGVSINKERVTNALKDALNKMKIKFKIDSDELKLNIYDKQVSAYVLPFSVGAINKDFPEWVWDMNKEQCRVLLESMCLGDGHTNGNTQMYDTSSLKLKDGVMRLALHAGWAANCYVKSEKGTHKIIHGRDSVTNADHWRITIVKKQLEPMVNQKIKGQQTEVEYSGKVYCFTVPNHVVYVRRTAEDGKNSQKPVFCGQSARHGQKGTIGRLVSVEDLPFDSQGVTPDIIVNSLAFPSRMTIAMLLELLSGKVIISSSPLHEITVTEAINGEEAPKEKTKKPESGSSKVSKKTPATAQYESHELSQEFRDSFISPTDPTCIDATPFRSAKSRGVSDSDEQRIDIIRKEMRKYGFDSGDQSMTDGVTGKRLRCLVFFGPVFYQKLKHFVIDKVHGRARGGRTALMRQPKEKIFCLYTSSFKLNR